MSILLISPLFLIIQEKNTYPLFKIEKRKGCCRPLLAIRNDDLLRRRGCTSSTVETVSSHNNFGRFLFLPLFYSFSFSFLFFYTSAPDLGGTSFFLTHQDAKNKTMPNFNEVTLRFDGSCKPNPGDGGSGYVIFDTNNDKTIIEGHYYVGGNCTNNVAEYFGLIAGLKHFQNSPYTADHLNIEGDSELTINQMKGTYRINSHRLKPLFKRVTNLLLKYCRGDSICTSVSFAHIDRRFNVRADALANDARYEENHGSQDLYDEGDGDDDY